MRNYILFLFIFFSISCTTATFDNPCDLKGNTFLRNYFVSLFTGNSSICGINTTSLGSNASNIPGPTITIQNLKDKSTAFTGFMIGSASDTSTVTKVEASYDAGNYVLAQGTTNWKVALPNGSLTWRDGTKHIISVKATNNQGGVSTLTINVFKGKNHDINGDGYSDLITTAEAAAPGIVYIFYSSGANGVTATSTTAASRTITGESTTTFGDIFVTGDLNGDGYADLVVSDSTFPTQGKIYIFYSTGSNGITTTLAASASRTILGANTFFGYSLDVGDVNGDGYTDLAVNSTISTQGGAYIFHSSANGISATNASGANTTILGLAGEDISNFISLGDYNGDGFADLSVSSTTSPATNKGRIFIFHSSGKNGITISTTTSASVSLTGTANQDNFGYSISSGDINGDGYADLVVGADQNSSGSPIGKFIIFLSNGITGINPAPLVTYTGELSGDRLGSFSTIIDLNADGFNDVVLGAGYSTTGNGKMYIFYSSSFGIPIVPITSANRIILGESGGGRLAAAISGADLNGDGYGDIITSANVLNSNDGRIYVFHSSGANGITNTTAASAILKINPVASSGGRLGYQVF